MSAAEIIGNLVALVGIVIFVWAMYQLIVYVERVRKGRRLREEKMDQAPYKMEPQNYPSDRTVCVTATTDNPPINNPYIKTGFERVEYFSSAQRPVISKPKRKVAKKKVVTSKAKKRK